MKCFRITNANTNGAFKIDETTYLCESVCSEEESLLITQAVSKWRIHYAYTWRCEARSDNGVDAKETKCSEINIQPEEFVIDETGVIGCYYEQHLFIFDDLSTHEFSNYKDTIYIGGWGDVTKKYYYKLKKLN